MTKKDRLGSDPLSFVKDTKEDNDNNRSGEAQNQEPVVGVLTENEPSDTALPVENNADEILELTDLKIVISIVNSNNISISLVGFMTIYNIEEIRNSIIKYFNKYNVIDIILTHITKIDTSGFQLILAIRKQAENNGKIIKLINPSDEVNRIFSLYGEDL